MLRNELLQRVKTARPFPGILSDFFFYICLAQHFPMQPLNWREKFSAILVLLIGILFLALQIVDYLSSKSNAFLVKEDTIMIDRHELFSQLRTLLTILLGIFGGILLFRKRTTGWIIGMGLLLLFLGIGGAGLIQLAVLRTFDAGFIFLAGCVVVLLLAILSLLVRSTREKYKVGKKTFLPTLVFLIAIAAVYLFLQ